MSASGGMDGQRFIVNLFMNSRTLNPIVMLGSYLGLAAGILLFVKGWHLFWWLPPLLGIQLNSQLAIDAAGGFIAGYLLHLLWRVASYHAGSVKINKK